MKSLFRAIRRKLLEEGKLLRYLTYALGEIVLIVVGILLALKINDWNEDKKNQSEFDEYIVQLKEDIKRVIEVNQDIAEYSETRAKNSYEIITFLEQSSYTEEELAGFERAFVGLGRYRDIQIEVGLLGELLNGNSEIISRDAELHQAAMNFVSELSLRQDVSIHIHENMSRDAQGLLKFRGPRTRIVPDMPLRYDLDELRKSKEFLNITQSLITRYGSITLQLSGMMETLEDFHATLEEYKTP